MDVFTRRKRSEVMSRIKGRDTKLEILVRRRLLRDGYRFQTNRPDLPGKPDVVIPKYKAAVFINGCFWHFHGCKLSVYPKTRPAFWRAKLLGNRTNDRRKRASLKRMGWRTFVLWECRLERDFNREVARLEARIGNSRHSSQRAAI